MSTKFGQAKQSRPAKDGEVETLGRAGKRKIATLLVVDDEELCRQSIQMLLAHAGYAVDAAASAEEALESFDPRKHELVLTDNRMPGKSGEQLARELKRKSPSTPVVMYTAFPPVNRSALDAIVEKPARAEQLFEVLADQLRRRRSGEREA